MTSPTFCTPLAIPLAHEIGHRRTGRAVQDITDVVADDAINLLRHRPIERAETGLDMCQRYVQLRRNQCPSHRRICVAVDEHGVRSLGECDRLERFQHAPRHRAMAAAMNFEMIIGLWNVQFSKKNFGHVWIEVLSGVNDHFGKAGHCGQRAANRRGLDELRTSTDDRDDLRQAHFTAALGSGMK